ncbi:hypothetical protein [Streptomyces sp. NPDC087270]
MIIVVAEVTEAHLSAAQSVRARYRDLDLESGLADAVNVALAAPVSR